MEFQIVRFSFTKESILGAFFKVFHEKRVFMAFTMEAGYKKSSEEIYSTLPEGEYRIYLTSSGKEHQEYSCFFPKFHRGMLELRGKDKQESSFIASGNSIFEESPVILLGDVVSENVTRPGRLLSSDRCYERVYKDIIYNLDREPIVKISITNFHKTSN